MARRVVGERFLDKWRCSVVGACVRLRPELYEPGDGRFEKGPDCWVGASRTKKTGATEEEIRDATRGRRDYYIRTARPCDIQGATGTREGPSTDTRRRCSGVRWAFLFRLVFSLASTVLGEGREVGPGMPDQVDFKRGPRVLPKSGSNEPAIDPVTGEDADDGRFEGKAIFVLSVLGFAGCGPATRTMYIPKATVGRGGETELFGESTIPRKPEDE